METIYIETTVVGYQVARPPARTRLRQAILQKAFTGELLTSDNTDGADKGKNLSVKSA